MWDVRWVRWEGGGEVKLGWGLGLNDDWEEK